MLEYKFDTQLLIEGTGLDEDRINDYITNLWLDINFECVVDIRRYGLIRYRCINFDNRF